MKHKTKVDDNSDDDNNKSLRPNPPTPIYVCYCGVCAKIWHKYNQDDANQFLEEHRPHTNGQIRLDWKMTYSGN